MAIAIMAVINIVHALKNPSEISEIVTMSTSDDDEIAAEAKDGQRIFRMKNMQED